MQALMLHVCAGCVCTYVAADGLGFEPKDITPVDAAPEPADEAAAK